jgi:Zn-dependent protease
MLELTRDYFIQALGISVPTPILEILDIIIMSLALGFIFKDYFGRPIPTGSYDPIAQIKSRSSSSFKFALMVTAPAIVLHELGHKFAAASMGVPSVLYAAYGWLLLGVFLKLINFNFLFFVPGFVAHQAVSPGVDMFISFAGPAVNLALFAAAFFVLKYATKLDPKYRQILIVTKKINLFLFIFNMVPVPPFDGSAIWNIFRLF